MKLKSILFAALAASAVQVSAQGENPSPFVLQLLHASDLEGGVNAIERAPFFAAIVDQLEETYPNTIRLSAGDNYIPGPFFNAASDPSVRPILKSVTQDYFGIAGPTDIREAAGRIDVSIANIIGLDASALGNHEFDGGPSVVQEIIAPLLPGLSVASSRWYGAQFPYLSSNLDFSGEPSLAPLYTAEILENTAFRSLPSNIIAAAAAPKIAQATLIERNGELIGVLGATTQVLATISSPGGVTETTGGMNNMPALAAVLQPIINDLIAAGANKIILVSHLQQFALEQALAGLLTGVDIIIAGGSDTVLANEDDRLLPGSEAAFDYPFVSMAADGNPLLLVSTDGEYSYVGRLVVEFDADGVIDLTSLDPSINGPYISDLEMVNDVWNNSDDAFAPNSKYDLVSRLTSAVSSVVITKDGNILGRTSVYLDGQRSQVRTQETNLGNLSADANLFVAKQFDATAAVSIKNGGGIRAAIGEVVETSPGVFSFLPPQDNPLSGKMETEVSQLDVENSLRFNNLLSLVSVNPTGLRALIEHGFSATAPGVTPGQFPQVGGVRVSFDPSLPAGARVRNLVIVDEAGLPVDSVVINGALTGDLSRTIRVVTLNFLAGGGDGYPFPAVSTGRVDLNTVGLPAGEFQFAIPGSEQDAIAEYLFAEFATEPFAMAETPAGGDLRIQNLSERNDAVYFFCEPEFFPAPEQLSVVLTSQSEFVTLRWDTVPGALVCRVRGGVVGGTVRVRDVYAVNGAAPRRLRVPKSELDLGEVHQFQVRCACSLDPIVASDFSEATFFVPLANQPSLILLENELESAVQFSAEASSMVIYPNPLHAGNAQLAVKSLIANSGATIEIFDMTGKRVDFENIAIDGFRVIELETSNLSKGMYLVSFTNGSERLTQRLIID